MTSTEDVKLTLRLFKLCAIILIYIHLTSCFFFWLAKIDRKWVPNQYVYYGNDNIIFDQPEVDQYIMMFYNGMLSATGNDILPNGLQ